MSDEDSLFSDDELPSLMDIAQCNFQSKNELPIQELYEKHCRLSRQLILEKIVQQDVDEDLSAARVNDIAPDLDSISIADYEEEKDDEEEEAPTIFTKPNAIQYFNLKDITLKNCGYESATNLSIVEEFLLTLELHEIYDAICTAGICREVQNVNSFVHFVLKCMSVHSDGAFVHSSKKLLTDLLAELDLEEIKFSSEDIFKILFNCSADVMRSEIFHILPPHQRIEPDHPKETILKEPIPEHWPHNLKSVLSCLTELLKGGCTISEEDLHLICIYFLMMSTEIGIGIYKELQKCLIAALNRFSPCSWPVYRSKIATIVATFTDIIPLNRQWFYIYSMVKSIPLSSSNGVELRKYISVLVLLNLSDDADTLHPSLEYSDELFSLSNVMIILSSLCINNTNFQHVIIKFLDILVSHLKFQTEEYEQLCKLLTIAEKSFKISSNLLHLGIIRTRINLSKLSPRRVKTLLDNSNRLQGFNPGENDDMDEESDIKMEDMQDTKQEELQNFSNKAELLEKSALSLCLSQEEMHDITRELDSIKDLGEKMIGYGHYASNEIQERLDKLLPIREVLHAKTLHLNQLCDLQCFLRKAEELDAISIQLEANLSISVLDNTEENSHCNLISHDATETSLVTLTKKLKELQDYGDKLLQEKHLDSETIRKRLLEVTNRISNIQEVSNSRRQEYAHFEKEASEAILWMNEKKKYIDAELDKSQIVSFDVLKNKMQDYNTFHAEISAYKGNIQNIIQKGKELLSTNIHMSNEIKQQLTKLEIQFNELIASANCLPCHLEKAKDVIADFNNLTENIEAWIVDTEAIVQADDMGKDFEHCQALKRKLDNVNLELADEDSKLKAMESRMNELKDLGFQFIENQKLGELNTRLTALQVSLNLYLQKIANTLDVYSFKRDLDAINDKISEKLQALSMGEEAEDLESVKSSQKKLEATKNSMSEIETKIKELDTEAQRLIQIISEVDPQARTRLSEVYENFKKLTDLCVSREKSISPDYALHKFLTDVKDIATSVSDITAQSTSESVRNDSEVQSMLEVYKKHKDKRQEAITSLEEFSLRLLTRKESLKKVIDIKQQQIIKCKAEGEKMIESGHYPCEKIREHLVQLFAVEKLLHATWTNINLYFDQLGDLQNFLKIAEVLDIMSSQQELSLSISAIESYTVEELQHQLKRHDDFEKLLATQDNKLTQLQNYGSKLFQQKRYDCETIKNRLLEVQNRISKVRHLSNLKKQELNDLYLHTFFKKEAHIAESWIKEKEKQIKTEQDMSGIASLDETKRKRQNCQTFHAEILAYNDHIQTIEKAGEELLTKNHKNSAEIRQKLKILKMQFNELSVSANILTSHLVIADGIVQFNNLTKNIEAWIIDAESIVQAGETGKDFEDCLALRRKLDVEMKITDAMQTIDSFANKVQDQVLPGIQFIQQKQLDLNAKWKALQEPLNLYRQKVANALLVYSFKKKVNDTNEKINEKLLTLSADEEHLGRSESFQMERKIAFVSKDMAPIQTKLEELKAEAHKLIHIINEVDPTACTRLSEVHENWKKLTDLCLWEQSTSSTSKFDKFLFDVNNLKFEVNDIVVRLTSELLTNNSEVQRMLEMYQDEKAGTNERQEVIKNFNYFLHHLKKKNEVLKKVIDKKQLQVKKFKADSETIIYLGHHACKKMKEHLDQLCAIGVDLNTTWTNKNIYLDHLHDLKHFLILAEQLDLISSQQEPYLSSSIMSNTAGEVLRQLKRHQHFEKLFTNQGNKLVKLQKYKDKLLLQQHIDCKSIEKRWLEVFNRRSKLQDLSRIRKKELGDNYLHAHFNEKVSEVELWIEEKIKCITSEVSRIDNEDSEAELIAKKSHIRNIEKEGQELSKNSKNSNEIIQKFKILWNKFNELTELSRFNKQTKKIETWIRNTESIVQEGVTGKNVEHCQALKRKLDNVILEWPVENARKDWIGSLANKIMKKGLSNMHFVQRLEEINTKWAVLQDALDPLCQKVSNMLDVYSKFNRDVDSIKEKIHEILPALSVDAETKDLESVKSCQKELESTKNNMSVIEEKIKELDVEAEKLVVDPLTKTNLSEVHKTWKELTELFSSREQSLSSAYLFHKFLLEYMDLETWVSDIIARMTSDVKVQLLPLLHQEQKAEIIEKQEAIKGLKEFGQRLLKQKHVSKEIMERKLQKLDECTKNLAQTLEDQQDNSNLTSVFNDHASSNSKSPVPSISTLVDTQHADSVDTKNLFEIKKLSESFPESDENLPDFSFQGFVSLESSRNIDTNKCIFQSLVEIEVEPQTLASNSLRQEKQKSDVIVVEQRTVDFYGIPNSYKVEPSKELSEISETEAILIPENHLSIPEIQTTAKEAVPVINVNSAISLSPIEAPVPNLPLQTPTIENTFDPFPSYTPIYSTGICSSLAMSNELIPEAVDSSPSTPLIDDDVETSNTETPKREIAWSPMPDIVLSNIPETLPSTSKSQLTTNDNQSSTLSKVKDVDVPSTSASPSKTLPSTSKRQLVASEVSPKKRLKTSNQGFCTLTKVSNEVQVDSSTSASQSKQSPNKVINRYLSKISRNKKSSSSQDIPVLEIDSESDDECQIINVVQEKPSPQIILLD